jgi:hypothetical protein
MDDRKLVPDVSTRDCWCLHFGGGGGKVSGELYWGSFLDVVTRLGGSLYKIVFDGCKALTKFEL